MKRLLIFLLIVLGLASCSAPKLYQQGIDKINKAIQKDSTLAFPTDTITEIEYDTIPGENGEPTIIKIKETVEIPCDFDVDAFVLATREKTNRELRWERRNSKDSLKHERKMHKLDNDRYSDSLSYLKQLNRQLTKQIKDGNDKEEKLAKEKTKQEKGGWWQRQMGKIWWLLLIIGLVAGLFIRSWIPKIPNPFKRNSS